MADVNITVTIKDAGVNEVKAIVAAAGFPQTVAGFKLYIAQLMKQDFIEAKQRQVTSAAKAAMAQAVQDAEALAGRIV